MVNLSRYSDTEGQHLPDSLLKIVKIPPQIGSVSEAEAIELMKSITSKSTTFMMSSNFVVNLLLSGSLSQLWSMLNSQQFSLHFPLFNKLKFPGNALSFNEVILQIAKFDMISTGELIDRLIFYLPEEEAYNEGFKNCNYNSTLLVGNISTIVWIYALHLACSLLFACCLCLSTKNCKVSLTKTKCMSYFFWNGFIRLYMETFFELALVAILAI